MVSSPALAGVHLTVLTSHRSEIESHTGQRACTRNSSGEDWRREAPCSTQSTALKLAVTSSSSPSPPSATCAPARSPGAAAPTRFAHGAPQLSKTVLEPLSLSRACGQSGFPRDATLGLAGLLGVPSRALLALPEQFVEHACSKPVGGSRRRVHGRLAHGYTSPPLQAASSTNPGMRDSPSSVGVEQASAGTRLEPIAWAFIAAHCGWNWIRFDLRAACSRPACGDSSRPLGRRTEFPISGTRGRSSATGHRTRPPPAP